MKKQQHLKIVVEEEEEAETDIQYRKSDFYNTKRGRKRVMMIIFETESHGRFFIILHIGNN